MSSRRMRRRRSRKAIKAQKKDNTVLYSYMTMGVAAAAIAGFLYVGAMKKSVEISQQTLCPLDESLIPSHTVLLIDATDKLSPRYIKKLKNKVRRVQRRLDTYARFTVVQLNGNGDSYITEVLSLCSPKSPRNADSLVESKKILEKIWNDKFNSPLQEVLNKISLLDEADQTPLFESLDQVSNLEGFAEDMVNKKLIIVSDLMHHTKEWSFYRGTPPLRHFLGSQYYSDLMIDLGTTKIEVVYVRRSKLRKYQSAAHRKFWTQFFEEKGVEEIKWLN